MQSTNCNQHIKEDDDYCRSGMNGTIFCSYACIQQTYKGNYAKSKIDPIWRRYTYLKNMAFL